MDAISFDDFLDVQLVAGTVVAAEVFAEARKPAYLLQVDFGPEIGVLKSSAQITDRYTPDALIGRQVMAVVNFPPKQIGPIQSQCLVTGFTDAAGHIVLAAPDSRVPNGSRLLQAGALSPSFVAALSNTDACYGATDHDPNRRRAHGCPYLHT